MWEGVAERESSIPIGCSLSAAAELRLLLKCGIDLKRVNVSGASESHSEAF